MEERFKTILTKPLYTLTEEEFEIIYQNSIHFPDGVSGAMWSQMIKRAVDEVNKKNGIDGALSLIEDSYKELDRVYPNLFDEKAELLKTACLFFLAKKDQEGAHKKMVHYLYNALSQVHYNAVNERMSYYSFRGFSPYSLKDIEEETISLAHPREFNDPLDTILVYWLNEEIKKNSGDNLQLRYRLLMKKVAEHIKIRCLISGKTLDGVDIPVEDLNVLMWSHYADSHKGFCVKYEFNSELFDRSRFTQGNKLFMVDKIKYSNSIKIDNEPSIRMALLEKSDFWNYENEMRFVSFDCSGDDKEFPTVKCAGAAKAIYLGVKCPDANRRLMERAIGDKNIPLYQMSVDEDTLTRFKKILIG